MYTVIIPHLWWTGLKEGRQIATKKNQPVKIYQLKITLQGIRPPIWRRVLVPADFTLDQLHAIIQMTMGWTDSHLHMFTQGDVCFADPFQELEDTENEHKVRISEVLTRVKGKLDYEYDFGDGWQHQIVLEKILPADDKQSYPVCVKGKRACPPEDCGGVWSYQALIAVARDPKHEDYADLMEWLDAEFDPEVFDLDEINECLQGQ